MTPDLSAIPRNEIEVKCSQSGVFYRPNEGHCWIVAATKTDVQWDDWFQTVRDLMRAGF